MEERQPAIPLIRAYRKARRLRSDLTGVVGDQGAVDAARQRWGGYKSAGHELSYWQQGDKGWENKTPN